MADYYSDSEDSSTLPEEPGLGSANNLRPSDGKTNLDDGSLVESSEIYEKILSGDKVLEEQAKSHIIQLMTIRYPSSNDYFKLEAIRAKIKEKIQAMVNHLEENPGTPDPNFTEGQRYGWLLLAHTILVNGDMETKAIVKRDLAFMEHIAPKVLAFVDDPQLRIRSIAGDCIKLILDKMGFQYFLNVKGIIMAKIEARVINMEILPGAASSAKVAASAKKVEDLTLKACFQELNIFAKEYAPQFIKEVDYKFLLCILASLKHPDPGVREATFILCRNIADSKILREFTFGLSLTQAIVLGVRDVSSPVRVACGLAIRSIMENVKKDERDVYYSAILPPLCMSRYYHTDARFMLLCHSIWRDIIKGKGMFYISRYIDCVVNFYVQSATWDNVGVQVAAVSVIGELAQKLDKEVLRPHVPTLLKAVEVVIKSNPWQSSDVGNLSLSQLVKNYPHVAISYVERLIQTLFSRIEFPVPLYRRGVSAALARIMEAYGELYLDEVVQLINIGLDNIQQQHPSPMDPKVHTYFTVDRILAAQYAHKEFSHVDNTTKSEPWEMTDGCIYLIGDLAKVEIFKPYLPDVLQKLLKVVERRDYVGHITVIETTCKIIPLLFQGLDKTTFKANLDAFFDSIFYLLELNNNASEAALCCLDQLFSKLGPNILRGRVEAYNPRYLHHCDKLPLIHKAATDSSQLEGSKEWDSNAETSKAGTSKAGTSKAGTSKPVDLKLESLKAPPPCPLPPGFPRPSPALPLPLELELPKPSPGTYHFNVDLDESVASILEQKK